MQAMGVIDIIITSKSYFKKFKYSIYFTDSSRSDTSEANFNGFESERSYESSIQSVSNFANQICSNRSQITTKKSPIRTPSVVSEVSIKDPPKPRVRNPRKRMFYDLHQKAVIKVERHRNKTPEPARFHKKSQDENETDELFHQIKCFVPNTITITLLQTAIALIRAGFSESLSVGTVKQEKPDIKQESSSRHLVRNRKRFFTLGKNRHLPKLLIKKKGPFQTENLLKFHVE